jgi:RNA polymerase sigma-70 factor (ECF subfamily)
LTPAQERESGDLMRRAQAGDQDAYARLLTLLTSVTRQFARARVGSAVWIDDVVQETLVTVHRARHTYDAGRPFAPWFYAIASSRLIDVLRRERRVSAREVADDDLPDAGTDRGSARAEIDVEAVRKAVRSLPARQRAVIERLKFQDQSVRDVAGGLGMSESAVKVTAHRGYQVLKRLLGGRRREH